MSKQNILFIKGGKIVNHDRSFFADVLVENGIIKDVGEQLSVPEDAKVIDAHGKLVIPGGIDPHTHLETYMKQTRTADDFYTGTRAALAGGTTMIMNFVNGNHGLSLIDVYKLNRERADPKVCCDYAFHISLYGWNDKVGKEMEILAHEEGVNSFKCFMQNKGCKDEDMIEACKKCKELGAVMLVHAENCDLIDDLQKKYLGMGITGPEAHLYSRPEEVETEATLRAITIASQTNCPLYIEHINSISTAVVVSDALRRGRVIVAEAITAALATDGRHYYSNDWLHSAAYLMCPPLRDDPATPGYLMDCLSNRVLECVSTDHCAFNTYQKALGKDDFSKVPNGVNGIEDRMSIVWEKGVYSGKMDECRFVEVTSSNAAKVFNLYPRKGYIGKGSDADIVVWDPEATLTISAKTHHMALDFNIYEGMVCHGVPCVVIANGKVVLENGVLNVEKGSGRYIKAACFPDFFYKRINARDAIKPVKIEREPYNGPIAEVCNILI